MLSANVVHRCTMPRLVAAQCTKTLNRTGLDRDPGPAKAGPVQGFGPYRQSWPTCAGPFQAGPKK